MPGKRKWTSKWKGSAELAFNDGYQLKYENIRVQTTRCYHCNDGIRLNRSQPTADNGYVLVQPCPCKAGANVVNLQRFLSILHPDEAALFYDGLKARRQKNWTTAGMDVGSRSYFIEKHGVKDGNKLFENKASKCVTTNIAYFKGLGLSNDDAVRALHKRQGTRALDFAFKQNGRVGVQQWIERNAAWRAKLPRKITENYLETELISVAEHKSQYWWLTTVLTDLSKRMENIVVNDGEHLDHAFSKTAAFHLGINPKFLCAKPNLRVISYATNLAKKDLCSLSRYNLTAKYETFVNTENGQLYDHISETLLDCVGYEWTGW